MWTNAGNAYSSNNSYARTSNGSGSGSEAIFKGFGFSIPGTATINGIIVEIEGKLVSGSSSLSVAMWKDGEGEDATALANAKTFAFTTTEQYVSGGGAGDLWGKTWTPANINHADFGVFIWAPTNSAPTTYDFDIDHVRITVDYTDLTTVSDTENLGANVTEAEALVFALDDAENAAANVTEAETVVAHHVATPATATLATTGFSPAITTTALATPGTLALTLAAYAPAIVTPVTVTPGVLALSLTGYAPALTVAQRLYRNARMAAGAVAGGPRMQGGAARGPARTPGGVVRPT